MGCWLLEPSSLHPFCQATNLLQGFSKATPAGLCHVNLQGGLMLLGLGRASWRVSQEWHLHPPQGFWTPSSPSKGFTLAMSALALSPGCACPHVRAPQVWSGGCASAAEHLAASRSVASVMQMATAKKGFLSPKLRQKLSELSQQPFSTCLEPDVLKILKGWALQLRPGACLHWGEAHPGPPLHH